MLTPEVPVVENDQPEGEVEETQETGVAETPESDKPEAEEDEEQTETTYFDGETPLVLKIGSRKQRKKDVQLPTAKIALDISQEQIETTWSRIMKLFNWVGKANVLTVLAKEVLWPVCLEASGPGFDGDGFDEVKFWDAFRKGFDPRERKKSGPTLKEIQEQLVTLANDVLSLVTKLQSGEPLTEAEMNHLADIKIQQVKLTEAKAKKERRGKLPTAKEAKAEKKAKAAKE